MKAEQRMPTVGCILRTALVATLFIASVVGRLAWADAPPPREVDAASVIEELGNALAQGRRETGVHLSRLGFAAQVEELRKLDDIPLHAFSSRTMIEGLYRRAEIRQPGEGDRFLAVLYKDAESKSAALASDPDSRGCGAFPATCSI